MSAKKGKKVKGTTISLQEFNATNAPSNGQNVIYAPKIPSNSTSSWAQEMEDEEIFEKEKIVLPSAPRATRLLQQAEEIPNVAPFTAHLGNISYGVCEEDIHEFFQDLNIVDLRLPRDGARLRGFGYVEFGTKAELVEALGMSGEPLGGRPVRISLGAPGSNARGGPGGEERRGGGRFESDETPDDWRAGGSEVVDSLRPDAYPSDRRGGGGGYGRPDFGGRNEYGGRNDFGGRNEFGGRGDFGGRSDYGGGRGGDYGRRNDFGGGPEEEFSRSDMRRGPPEEEFSRNDMRRGPPEEEFSRNDMRRGPPEEEFSRNDMRRGPPEEEFSRNDMRRGPPEEEFSRSDMRRAPPARLPRPPYNDEFQRGGGGNRYDAERDDTPDAWRLGGGQVVDSVRGPYSDRGSSYGDDRRGGGGYRGGRPEEFGGRNDMMAPSRGGRPPRAPYHDEGPPRGRYEEETPDAWRSAGGHDGGRPPRGDDRRGGGGYGRPPPPEFGGRSEMMPPMRRAPPRESHSDEVFERGSSERRSGSVHDDRSSNHERRGSGSGRSETSETSSQPPSQSQQPRERKKLVLAPRTKPVGLEPAPESSPSIFGGAKPVDTAARERVIEEKLREMERMTIDTKGGDTNGKTGVGMKGPIRILKRNEGASALNSNTNMPPLIANNTNNRQQQRGFSHGRTDKDRDRTSSESSQRSTQHPAHPGHEDYEKDTNSEPEDERDLRRQQNIRRDSDDGFIEVHKRRSNHSKAAAAGAQHGK